MKGQSLKLSSIVLFYLSVLLASNIIVDAVKCSTTTMTTTTTTTISTSCTAFPTPVLTCDCESEILIKKSCGAGNGFGDGDCVETKTCTLTKTECKLPCCSAPYAPGWDNFVVQTLHNFIPGINSAEDCCKACMATDCLGWQFNIDPDGRGFCLQANNLGASNACLTPPVRTNWAIGIKSCPNGHPCAA